MEPAEDPFELLGRAPSHLSELWRALLDSPNAPAAVAINLAPRVAASSCIEPWLRSSTFAHLMAAPLDVSVSLRDLCAAAGGEILQPLALLAMVFEERRGSAQEAAVALILRRAAAAALTARTSGSCRPTEALMAGLLMDLPLLLQQRQGLPDSIEIIEGPAMLRVDTERATGRVEHPLLAQRMADRLGLHPQVGEALSQHHNGHAPESPLGCILWSAERTAAMWEGGDAHRTRTETFEAFETLGIDEDDGLLICRQLPFSVTELGLLLGVALPAQQSLDRVLLDTCKQLGELTIGFEDLVARIQELLEEKEGLELQLRAANRTLEQIALTDMLTGLANKRALADAMRRDFARAERSGTSIAMVILDLDHFKHVNDTYGHAVGDEVLREVGRAVSAGLRSGDISGRFGGEEFVLILPGATVDGGKLVAERLRRNIEAVAIKTGSTVLRVTASFGVAAVSGPGTADLADATLKRADDALYRAKHEGRNRVCVATLPLPSAPPTAASAPAVSEVSATAETATVPDPAASTG
jgi:diguanylate cyclase (GGDEF)-like protein